MKNFKQIAFGLMVGAMAIAFSAFTTGPSKSKNGLANYVFTHPAHSNSDTKVDYIYESDPNGCSQSTTNICTAQWSQSTAPTNGQQPSTSATEVSGSQSLGNYQN
jgi:hypothetical protein